MALGSVPWERDVIVSVNAAAGGLLCDAMRRLPPNVGSFFAEVTVAGAEPARKILDIILVPAALVHMWDQQDTCPIVTHLAFAHAEMLHGLVIATRLL